MSPPRKRGIVDEEGNKWVKNRRKGGVKMFTRRRKSLFDTLENRQSAEPATSEQVPDQRHHLILEPENYNISDSEIPDIDENEAPDYVELTAYSPTDSSLYAPGYAPLSAPQARSRSPHQSRDSPNYFAQCPTVAHLRTTLQGDLEPEESDADSFTGDEPASPGESDGDDDDNCNRVRPEDYQYIDVPLQDWNQDETDDEDFEAKIYCRDSKENCFSTLFVDIVAKHRISYSAASELFKLACTMHDKIPTDPFFKKGFKCARRASRKHLPIPRYDIANLEEDGTVKWTRNLATVPRQQNGVKVAQAGYIQVKDLRKFHLKVHGITRDNGDELSAHLSNDGVQESKSSIYSLNTFSMRFRGCICVYVTTIVRTLGGLMKNYGLRVKGKPYLEQIIQGCNDANIEIGCVIGDAPKRSELAEVLGHGSYFACDFCKMKATAVSRPKVGTIQSNEAEEDANSEQQTSATEYDEDLPLARVQEVQRYRTRANGRTAAGRVSRPRRGPAINLPSVLEAGFADELGAPEKTSKKGTKRGWPCTDIGRRRTHMWTKEVAENLNQYPENERFGIVGRSALFDIPGFDIIEDLIPDYMHFVALGVVKLLVSLTFDISDRVSYQVTRDATNKIVKVTITHKSDKAKAKEFNEMLRKVRGPYEFSRRTRDLEPSVWKAEEYRNLILFLFPLCWDVMPSNQPRNVRLYSTLAFLIRAYTLPDLEFSCIPAQLLEDLGVQFVQLMYLQHSEWNCTYNVHLILHLPEMRRKHGPLFKTSAFLYESMFAQMVRAFEEGTPNVMSQIFEKLYRRIHTSHACRKKIYIGTKETQRTMNAFFYTFNKESKQFQFYKAESEFNNEAGVFARRCSTRLLPRNDFDWNLVGVHKYMYDCDEIEIIPAKDVRGKAIEVKDYLISISNGLLRESGTHVRTDKPKTQG